MACMAKLKAQFRRPSASEQLVLEHLQLRRLGEPSESARCDTSIVEDHCWPFSAAWRWAWMSSTRSVAPRLRAAAQSFVGKAGIEYGNLLSVPSPQVVTRGRSPRKRERTKSEEQVETEPK